MSRKSTRTPQTSQAIKGLVKRASTAHLRAIALRSAVFGSVAIILSGFGHALFHPVRDESHEAAGVVAAIVNQEPGTAAHVANLTDDLGYEPLTESGQMQNPNGGCSTPLPIGPEEFENACRTHDLGYDLLRVAEMNGGRLGAWARFDLDRRLYSDLLARCTTLRCRSMATAYYTAVTTNSIRQGYKAPTEEPTTPWIGLGLMVFGLAVITEPRGAFRTIARYVVCGMAPPRQLRSDVNSSTGHPSRPRLPSWGVTRLGRPLNASHRGTLRGTV